MIFSFNKNKINIVVNCAALGDTICSLPIIYALLKEGRINRILSNEKWKDLFPLTDIPGDMVTYMQKDKVVPFDPGPHHTAPLYLENRAPYCSHMVDFFSSCLCYAVLDADQKSINIPRNRLPVNPISGRRYVVLQSTTRLRSRTLLPGTWQQLKFGLFERGFEVVIIGDKDSDYDTHGCVTDFSTSNYAQSISILYDCSACIGVDGGLLYLASMTECPIVAGYSFVNPKYRLPFRHGKMGWRCAQVTPPVGCSFCTDSLCAYGIEFDVACPNHLDFECIKNLRAADFLHALDGLIGH